MRQVFSIITLLNEGHNCIFHKGFGTVYFGADKKNAVTLPHSTQRKNASKGLESKERKLAQLMFHPIDIWNARLGNALDVDLKIT